MRRCHKVWMMALRKQLYSPEALLRPRTSFSRLRSSWEPSLRGPLVRGDLRLSPGAATRPSKVGRPQSLEAQDMTASSQTPTGRCQ